MQPAIAMSSYNDVDADVDNVDDDNVDCDNADDDDNDGDDDGDDDDIDDYYVGDIRKLRGSCKNVNRVTNTSLPFVRFKLGRVKK